MTTLIFPGQGSQYVGMGRDLACVFPEAREAITQADDDATDAADRVSGRIFPHPVFDEGARAEQQAALTRTDVAQAQNGRAISDHGHRVALNRQIPHGAGVVIDRHADPAHPRRVRHGEVVARLQGALRVDLQLPSQVKLEC